MSSRRNRVTEEEDAAQLKLGADFSEGKASCLSLSEVKLLLESRTSTTDNAVLKKTVEYVTLFARFKDSETAIAARNVSNAGPHFKEFELAQIVTLCPKDAEEAKAIIPSLADREDEQLQATLNELQALRKFS